MKNRNHNTGRREFITKVSLAAAMGLMGTKAIPGKSLQDFDGKSGMDYPEMPTINLGHHKISRIICGSNPILGYSYLGWHTDKHMREYFTLDRTVEFLLKCEKAGITTHQCSSRFDYITSLQEKGSKMKIISLQSDRDKIKEAVSNSKPIAVAHHGGVTDRLFADGKSTVVHDYVKAVKDLGLLAGVSAHNPDVIRQIANEGWEVDFFMTCFYFLTRDHLKQDEVPSIPIGGYQFFKDDPKIMTQVIRQVKQPCLAFKILGAGRRCNNQEEVRDAFKFAFENIKPTDGIIVGMFPWYFDEIEANVEYTYELGK